MDADTKSPGGCGRLNTDSGRGGSQKLAKSCGSFIDCPFKAFIVLIVIATDLKHIVIPCS